MARGVKKKAGAPRKRTAATRATKKQSRVVTLLENRVFIRTIALVAIVVFIGMASLWYSRVYASPRNVFWGMVRQSLASDGYVRTVVQKEGTAESLEYTRFNFTFPPTVELGRTIINDSSKVVTEGLGTTTDDFQRFIEVSRPEEGADAPNYKAVLGQWVSINDTGQSADDAQEPTILLRSMLGPVISANLTPQQRADLIAFMQENDVYQLNLKEAKKEDRDGRRVVVINGGIKLRPFAEALQLAAAYQGLPGSETIDAEQYANDEILEVQFIVDIRSRHLVSLRYPTQNITETYHSYGISRQIDNPKSPITAAQFQERLQAAPQQ